MRWLRGQESGAILVIVLMFMTLVFILLTSMLHMSGRETEVAGLHRDRVRALEYAQTGLQEAVERMKDDRPFSSFSSALSAATNVTVTRRGTGTGLTYEEISSSATAGRATRRLGMLVLRYMSSFPPNILFGDSVSETGQSNVSSGEVYSRKFVQYREGEYTSSNRVTYAGWRISKCVDPEKSPTDACKPDEYPAKIQPCFTHAQCVALGPSTANWYPGTRRGESEKTALGQDIRAQMLKCPAGGGGSLPLDVLPAGAIAADGTDISWQPMYGFDRDDATWQGWGITPQAVNSGLPCGLPYKWVQQTFAQEKTSEPQVTRWFKTIVHEQWFNNYWEVNPSQLSITKKPGLENYPEFGAIPPVVDVNPVNADVERTGGGNIDETMGINYGCKSPEMVCAGGSQVSLVWLKGAGATWNITGNVKGHGTIVVDGNLQITGNFEYWGTIVVEGPGTVVLGAGNVTIHGGIVTRNRVEMGGNTIVEGGTNVPNAPVGPWIVVSNTWWER